MAEFNYYDPVQAAQQRRAQAMTRLAMLAQARQQYTNQMYQKQQQQMAEAERKRQEFEANEKKNSTGEFFGGASGGAGIGSLIGSIVAPGVGTAIGAGIGALAGGIGGAAIGMSEAKAEYKKEGKHYGAGEFFRSLPGVGDIAQAQEGKWDSSYINPRAIGSLAMTGAQVGAANRQPTVAGGPNWANGETETGYSPSEYLSNGVSGNTMSPSVANAFTIPDYDPEVARNLGEAYSFRAPTAVPSPYAPGALWALRGR